MRPGELRRHPDGSIDHDFYRAKARALRTRAPALAADGRLRCYSGACRRWRFWPRVARATAIPKTLEAPAPIG
jgi:hypothetical protein